MAHGVSENKAFGNIIEFIDKTVKEAIGKVFDEAIERAIEDAKSKRDEVIAQTALKLTSWMSIEESGRIIRIEIGKNDGS